MDSRLKRFGIVSNIAVFAISSVTIASSNVFGTYIGKEESWCPFDIPGIFVGGWGYNIWLFCSIVLFSMIPVPLIVFGL